MTIDKLIKCGACGKFISHKAMQEQKAHFHFEPDSDRGSEVSEWICEECVK